MTQSTAAKVDFEIQNNATWNDALQFGTPGDLSWSLTNQNFRCDLKKNTYDASPVLSLTSGAGQIVVQDPVQRIVNFNVPESVLQTLPVIPFHYRYDFIMYDNSTPPVRVLLMSGKIKVEQGITGG